MRLHFVIVKWEMIIYFYLKELLLSSSIHAEAVHVFPLILEKML